MDIIKVYVASSNEPFVFQDNDINVEYQLGTIYNQFFEQIGIRKTHELGNIESNSSISLGLKTFATTIGNNVMSHVDWYKDNILINSLQVTPIELSYNILSLPDNTGVEEYLAFNKGKSAILAAIEENNSSEE